MSYWLYDRLKEIDKNYPDPHFAFKGSTNWIHSLALLCNSPHLESKSITQFYDCITKDNPYNSSNIVYSMENLLLSIHNYKSIEILKTTTNPNIVLRSAIISWYYCNYYAIKAMNMSVSGQNSETHSKTANIFKSNIIRRNLIPEPFSFEITSLVKMDIDEQSNKYKSTRSFKNNWYPTKEDEAYISFWSYLKGTAYGEHNQALIDIKKTKEFRELRKKDFRSNQAKEFRDRSLSKKSVNFLNLAFRYRGKANYRDSIYLSYDCREMIFEPHYDEARENYLKDLATAAKKILELSMHLVKRKSRREEWEKFVLDVENNNLVDFTFTEILNSST